MSQERERLHFSTDSRTALDWCAKRTQKAVQEVVKSLSEDYARQRDEDRELIRMTTSERDALAAQLSALRPVVEAARAWADPQVVPNTDPYGASRAEAAYEAYGALLAALRTLEESDGR